MSVRADPPKNLPIDFKVEQKEWDSFWNWIYSNTIAHHIGPQVSLILIDPGLKRIRDLSMLIFLIHKDTIIHRPPICICKNRYIHINDHLKDCPIKQFNDKIMSFK
jgi:hypothetical protein